MTDLRQFAITPRFDLEQTLGEAQHRWLTPVEICEIFMNYHDRHLTPNRPNRPPSGSLLLFDGNVDWDFGLDCYNWRKGEIGNMVKAVYERINAESNIKLDCFHSHLEDNENFQRREYWMLEEPFMDSFLVHYLEIKMENSSINQDCIDLDDVDVDDTQTSTQAEVAKKVKAGDKGKFRKRKFTSDVWNHFDILPLEAHPNGQERAKCKNCPTTYLSASSHGTGNMRRHMRSCSARTNRNIGQMLISQPSSNISLRETKFDQNIFRELLNHAIIRHELPLRTSDSLEKTSSDSVAPSSSKRGKDILEAFDGFDDDVCASFPTKSQLQLYMDEPKWGLLDEVDILDFWKGYQYRYPELSLMARDVLSIPVSTVASESTFSVGGRMIDPFHSSLTTANAEALVCTRDWLFERRGEVIVDDMEANMEDSENHLILMDNDRQTGSHASSGGS